MQKCKEKRAVISSSTSRNLVSHEVTARLFPGHNASSELLFILTVLDTINDVVFADKRSDVSFC